MVGGGILMLALLTAALANHLAGPGVQGGEQRRGAGNHACAVPPVPAAWAIADGCDPGLGSGTFRPRTGPTPDPVDSGIAPQRP